MALIQRWAGNIWGTNVGNLFLKIEGDEAAFRGVLHINEQAVGVTIYNVEGALVGKALTLKGVPVAEVEGAELGQFVAQGAVNANGEIHGDWQTTIGTAGPFILHPHPGAEQTDEIQPAQRSHTAKHEFGAIEINREQIIEIAQNIQRDFPQVIISTYAGTQQSFYLDDFKQLQPSTDKAEVVTVYASKPDSSGVNRAVTVEFGPNTNYATTQGPDEAWVLGQLETFKRDLKRYERSYVTNYKRWGIGINQLMLIVTVVFLPSLDGFKDRSILMAVVIGLIAVVNALHSKFLPFADIQLREKKASWLGKAASRVASWGIGIVAAALATLAGAYLEGALEIFAPSTVIEVPNNR